ncbi:MAG: ABC transporter permease subunit [Saccharofermentans sp.]|nr:ABC transporter permease subunit [Mageeibacillus sp.]MCI1263903.1 ABC transporter permease subunit [Saccharofermentans sp.]MCI1275640.1 ABC transporter permease subunit [Saccharofermentans sp.]MCI2043747.1 ABC transporter permease subunit [Mageeibacillus sp.]
MLDLLKFEYKRILSCKAIYFMLAFSIICPLTVVIAMELISTYGDSFGLIDGSLSATKLLNWFVVSYFYSNLPMVIALFSSLFVGRDYKDGFIRNKITAGHSRADVFFSTIISQVSVIAALSVVYVSTGFLALAVSSFDVNVNHGEMLLRLLTLLLSLIGMTILFTALALVIKSRAAVVILCVVFVMSFSLAGLLATSYSYSRKTGEAYIDLCEDYADKMKDQGQDDYDDYVPERKDVFSFGWYVGRPFYLLTNAGLGREFVTANISSMDYSRTTLHDGFVNNFSTFFTESPFWFDDDDLADIDGCEVSYKSLMFQYNIKSIVWSAIFACGGYAIFRKKDLN